jgi:uncharacterized repeat protein (TIGR03803 family)
MKKLLFLLIIITFTFFLSPSTSLCQNHTELWGMTSDGGNGGGVIFKTDSNAENLQVMHAFIKYPGQNPCSDLCQASNGKLYGMTWEGGMNNLGTLFEYDPTTGQYNLKLDFAGSSNGKYPCSLLIQASNGKLYGMTFQGGTNNYGVLFEYDPISNSYSKKLDFDGAANGSYPQGSLIQASNGKLYGMTWEGGTNNFGVLFEYDLATDTYTKKIDFAGTSNGSVPQGSLMQATNGKLYGMTNSGGTNDYGVLFEYDPAINTYTKKMDFGADTNGVYPYGSLIQASNGKLYGMTNYGGVNSDGVIFEYDFNTSTYTKKLDFDGNNGAYPFSSLFQASNGKLYGMTRDGGSNGKGVLFEYDPAIDFYAKKVDFAGITNGSNPLGSLMQASNGKLYGMTYYGGAINPDVQYGCGILFDYDLVTETLTKKFDFSDATDGSKPYGSLIQASNGKLYGMTSRGGIYGWGTVFEYNLSKDSIIKKEDLFFTGKSPYGSLMQASDGKLYGMTHEGGYNYCGVLFEYNLITETCVTKEDFMSPYGASPYGSIIQASNGKLYGMTNIGGSSDYGVLFEYIPSTDTYTKKVDFYGGHYPYGSLIQATNGKLYGMTNGGGVNNIGILFEYDLATNFLTKKLDFAGVTNGSAPYGSLIQASNGKLYGMTYEGGSNNNGILFEYNPSTGTYTKKLDFDGAAYGSNPQGSLIQASNGKLYGMTANGGSNGYGVVFEYNITNNTCTKKQDFNYVNGKRPIYTQLIEICDAPVISTNPNDVLTCPGSNISFSFGVTGNGLLYQWQVNDGSGFTNIINNTTYSNSTNNILHITNASTGMNGYKFRCKAKSTCSLASVISDSAILQVSGDSLNLGVSLSGFNITANFVADSYQWLDCNNAFAPISGAILQSYTATANGNYAVLITQGNCSDTSACIAITSYGINEMVNCGIALYPNPSNGQFTLVLDEAAKIELYNTLGILVFKENFEKGKHNLSLGLADGIYLIKAVNDKTSRSLKMLIQN